MPEFKSALPKDKEWAKDAARELGLTQKKIKKLALEKEQRADSLKDAQELQKQGERSIDPFEAATCFFHSANIYEIQLNDLELAAALYQRSAEKYGEDKDYFTQRRAYVKATLCLERLGKEDKAKVTRALGQKAFRKLTISKQKNRI